jgi:type IV pilus assembly protein PilZ
MALPVMRSDGDREGGSRPPESQGANRRVAERFSTSWSVDCVSEDTFLYASITNISLFGIFVATKTPFEVGALVDLKFAPGGSTEPFSLPGRVQWVNKSSALRQSKNEGMGIHFVSLSPEDRERLVEVIHTIAYLRDSAN